jgi:outer membrane protein assembly factor BamB
MVVTPTVNSLTGASLADGKILWETPLPIGGDYKVNYPTPIIDSNTVIYFSPGKGPGSSMALRIEKEGGEFKAREAWKSSGAYLYNTPVLKDNLLFGLSAAKKFFCMDAKSGNVLWTDDTPRGEAGALLNGGSVILALTGPAPAGGDKGGKGFGKGVEKNAGEMELVVFEPSGSAYKEIAKYKLAPGSGLAYPIVAGNRVYVKGNTEITLYSIE